MRRFVLFYRWGMETKYSMGLYFSGLVFMKAISDAVAGRFAMDTLVLIEMLLTSFVFACLESWLFPKHREQRSLGRNTVLWVLLAHLCLAGGALTMHWFDPTPVWMAVILVAVLEFSLLAMWFGFHVALKCDTVDLNRKLRDYQDQGVGDKNG